MHIRSNRYIDPLGQPKVTAGRDHCFSTCSPYVRTSVLTFKSRKTKQQKTMFATGVTGRVDHWWHLSCAALYLSTVLLLNTEESYSHNLTATLLYMEQFWKCLKPNTKFHCDSFPIAIFMPSLNFNLVLNNILAWPLLLDSCIKGQPHKQLYCVYTVFKRTTRLKWAF